ncbi:aldo/keto reductase [Ulvibacterium marinum]|uniref:Aldo/keto reductase n=1 Tax=Ulvibacterium marinum TaxID=2419782 RepID=A0A3B0CEN3_9FLAO|nr:aldo/keto reductase [Ulvibacterium marinum]RKN83328.1 aldo/keto reductase [Ulvibacterium marinum]
MENRRNFLKKSASAAAFSLVADWASAMPTYDKLGETLPQRQLIRNGEKVTSFCLGGYHLGLTEDPKEAEKMVERSMELGVRFFDNARRYNNGRSEEYMGKFLTPKYRDQIFLMSKAPARTGKGVQQQLDESLKALKTDYLDLWQIHTFTTPQDVDNRLRDGVLDVFLEAKEKGKTRYLGFTGHQNPKTHLYFLNKLDELGIEFDTCQMPLNVCDPSFESFQHEVLPVLNKKGYGVIAMKTMAGGSMMGGRIDTTPQDIRTKDIPDVVAKTELTHANLHQYVYSLPVSSLCSGCRFTYELEENVKVLKDFKKLSVEDMDRLVNYAKPYAGLIVENYKRVFA